MMKINRIVIITFYLFLIFLPKAETCLPSWFRQERSAEPLEGNEIQEIEEANDFSEIGNKTKTTIPPDKTGANANVVVDDFIEGSNEYVEYIDEEPEKEERETKYNEDAIEVVQTRRPEEEREIVKLKTKVCQDYCEHNATCHGEESYHSGKLKIIPVCDCRPIRREGPRCEYAFVQPFYAKASGNNEFEKSLNGKGENWSRNSTEPSVLNYFLANLDSFSMSSSPLPVLMVLLVMLGMLLSIVVYAYKKLSQRNDEMTYTMSNLCPPEAFTVLKTPNGRKISVHCDSMFPVSGQITLAPGASNNSQQRIAMRQNAIMFHEKNNFFSILRTQGTIPSRNINEDDTPKQYKYVPRVEVSAINNSGHIDFSTISYPTNSPSQPRSTSPPHIAIQMDDIDFSSNQSISRADNEQSIPSINDPMIKEIV